MAILTIEPLIKKFMFLLSHILPKLLNGKNLSLNFLFFSILLFSYEIAIHIIS